ncbi:MAG: BrnT family toxin [Candidatus Methanoperedens sp.]|nr:BrnT family toxin [Candidatus Methanoperedens sp.]
MKRKILIEWDCKSLDHISKHNVSEKEVEIAMNGAILIRNTSRNGEKLKEVIGESHGRILFVVLKLSGDKYKVITARDATRAEKKLYMKKGK